MKIVGIDPGVSPALGFTDGKRAGVHRIEEGKGVAAEVTGYLRRAAPGAVVVEQVGVIAGQGLSSSGRFMEHFGIIKGVVIALDIPLILVLPSKWKRELLADYDLGDSEKDPVKRKKAQKRAAIDFVTATYPQVSLILPRCRTADDDLADALCMATWGLNHNGR